MVNNIFEGKVLWSQIDGNLHLRHSAYADFAAQARVEILEKIGMDFTTLAELKIGPVLFREELIYLKEIKINESVKIETLVTKTRNDFSRWSFRHELYRGDGLKSAIINVDGAWIDITKRKLTTLPEKYFQQLLTLPRSEDFQES
ncbi:MAG TPA: acyl-CoA thioesterase [Cytophagales bacterium]|nr:acyl-CoA thioesterase [Cytophagales bacterium]